MLFRCAADHTFVMHVMEYRCWQCCSYAHQIYIYVRLASSTSLHDCLSHGYLPLFVLQLLMCVLYYILRSAVKSELQLSIRSA